MSVLVDTSVWIEYFRGSERAEKLDFLIEENILLTNDIILAELIPFLRVKNQRRVVKLLQNIKKLVLNINWEEIIDLQYNCLKKGINGIGIPDLIIAQNVFQNNCKLYTLDNHFELLKKVVKIQLF
jgi:predicted nucleic acid-binding protein